MKFEDLIFVLLAIILLGSATLTFASVALPILYGSSSGFLALCGLQLAKPQHLLQISLSSKGRFPLRTRQLHRTPSSLPNIQKSMPQHHHTNTYHFPNTGLPGSTVSPWRFEQIATLDTSPSRHRISSNATGTNSYDNTRRSQPHIRSSEKDYLDSQVTIVAAYTQYVDAL